MKIINTLIKFLMILLMTTCNTDDSFDDSITLEKGFFTINRGTYPFNGTYESSINFRDYDQIKPYGFGRNVYFSVNNENINGYIEDFVVDEQFGYILVNNEEEDEDMLIIVNKHTFKIIKKIKNGIIDPSKLITYKEKAFIISWSNQKDNYIVQEVNTQTGDLITSFEILNLGYESLISRVNNKVYISESGDLAFAQKIIEIDADINTITNIFNTELEINSMLSANNNLYVCGSNCNEDFSKIYSINTTGIISLVLEKDHKLMKNLTYDNGLFSLMVFDSMHISFFGTIYNWNGIDNTFTNPIEEEVHGYSFSRTMTSFSLKDRLLYITDSDGRYILDIDTKSFNSLTSTGPNTFKVVFIE